MPGQLQVPIDHGRYGYSPIVSRSVYDWPAGKRLAVYIALNLEQFTFGAGLGAELAPGGPHPDVLNYSWRDYGNRVGVWRPDRPVPGAESADLAAGQFIGLRLLPRGRRGLPRPGR